MGQWESDEVQQRGMKSAAHGEEQAHSSVRAGSLYFFLSFQWTDTSANI